MTTFDDVLKAAKPPERTVPLCLAGDLQAEFETLERRLRESREADDGTLAGGTRQLAESIQDVRGRMRDHTITFRVRALPRSKWSDLMAQHPPRKDRDDGDVNWDTFPVAAIAACCVEPELTAEQSRQLADETLTQGQFDALFIAVRTVNVSGGADVPFSAAASAVLASSAPR